MTSNVEKQENKAFRLLKQENAKLRKEVKRLQKDNRQLHETLSQYDELVLEAEIQEEKREKKKKEPLCPSCFSPGVKIIVLRDKKYYQCDECRSKGKMPEEDSQVS